MLTLPKPYDVQYDHEGQTEVSLFTLDQMLIYANAALLAEREACIKVCELQAAAPECPERALHCAEAIRMRSSEKKLSGTPAGWLRLWLSRQCGLQVWSSEFATGMQPDQWGADAHAVSGAARTGRWA